MQSVEPPINGRFAEGLWADRVTYDVDPTCRAQARAGCCCGEADCIPAVGLLPRVDLLEAAGRGLMNLPRLR
jgi:hypothetical protein